MYKHILVPTDGSPLSRAAALSAVKLAQARRRPHHGIVCCARRHPAWRIAACCRSACARRRKTPR